MAPGTRPAHPSAAMRARQTPALMVIDPAAHRTGRHPRASSSPPTRLWQGGHDEPDQCVPAHPRRAVDLCRPGRGHPHHYAPALVGKPACWLPVRCPSGSDHTALPWAQIPAVDRRSQHRRRLPPPQPRPPATHIRGRSTLSRPWAQDVKPNRVAPVLLAIRSQSSSTNVQEAIRSSGSHSRRMRCTTSGCPKGLSYFALRRSFGIPGP